MYYCASQKRNPPLTPALRIPIALQWLFPTPLALLIWYGPESPWWLVRKGRLDEATKVVTRLGRTAVAESINDSVAMMRRTVELEKTEKEPSLIELWKGTDRYRTLIVCCVYAAQNLTGNLIANQAVYFFERELTLFLTPLWRTYQLTSSQGPASTQTLLLPWVSSPPACRLFSSCSLGFSRRILADGLYTSGAQLSTPSCWSVSVLQPLSPVRMRLP